MSERQLLVTWIREAIREGARLSRACEEAFISLRTFRRWVASKGPVCSDKRPMAVHPAPPNKLSDSEVAEILAVCNHSEYASLPPSQIVPRLADKGLYLASESTFYRILKAHNQLTHRGRSKARCYTRQGVMLTLKVERTETIGSSLIVCFPWVPP